MDTQSGTTLAASQNIENYHQVITIETETLTETNTIDNTYAITEATVFPAEGLAYGQRINKGTNLEAYKTTIYASDAGAFQKKDDAEWVASATPDPLFASIAVYPYETFAALATLFESKGSVVETNTEYVITYSGYDEALNRELADLVQQFPMTGTTYEATITLDKETEFITAIELHSETASGKGKRAIHQRLSAQFSRYNANEPRQMTAE